MRKTLLLLALVAATLLAAGCSDLVVQQGEAQRQGASRKQQAAPEQEKTVVVNKGMSKKEEEKLNERIAKLEKKIDDQPPERPTREAENVEASALAAAKDYYAAAAAGDYSYTYSKLTAYDRSQFTQNEWVADNTALGSDAGIYNIDSINVVDPSTVEVYLTITTSAGSSSERVTRFVLENGSWKHELTQAEYELFAGATATASASPSASASATGDTKHVEVVITSNKPADVSISDDSLDWLITEEIVGTETYERNIVANSGLSVSATTDAYRAQTAIEVYENGELVAQDSDPNGFALVNY